MARKELAPKLNRNLFRLACILLFSNYGEYFSQLLFVGTVYRSAKIFYGDTFVCVGVWAYSKLLEIPRKTDDNIINDGRLFDADFAWMKFICIKRNILFLTERVSTDNHHFTKTITHIVVFSRIHWKATYVLLNTILFINSGWKMLGDSLMSTSTTSCFGSHVFIYCVNHGKKKSFQSYKSLLSSESVK